MNIQALEEIVQRIIGEKGFLQSLAADFKATLGQYRLSELEMTVLKGFTANLALVGVDGTLAAQERAVSTNRFWM